MKESGKDDAVIVGLLFLLWWLYRGKSSTSVTWTDPTTGITYPVNPAPQPVPPEPVIPDAGVDIWNDPDVTDWWNQQE